MKKISFARVTALMAVGSAFGLISSAQADTLFTLDPTYASYADADYVNVGDTFTVGSSNIYVTDLGAYAVTSGFGSGPVSSDGVTITAFTAVLYNETTDTKIGSVDIPIGATVTDSFAFAPFSAELLANQTYAVTDFIVTPATEVTLSGYEKTPFAIVNGGSGSDPILTAGTGTSFSSASSNDVYTVYSSSAAPDPSTVPTSGNSGYYAFGGGNLEYSFTAPSVPEPSTYALLLGGFVLLAGYLRRRSA
jgi:PEP-CTERM motif